MAPSRRLVRKNSSSSERVLHPARSGPQGLAKGPDRPDPKGHGQAHGEKLRGLQKTDAWPCGDLSNRLDRPAARRHLCTESARSPAIRTAPRDRLNRAQRRMVLMAVACSRLKTIGAAGTPRCHGPAGNRRGLGNLSVSDHHATLPASRLGNTRAIARAAQSDPKARKDIR